MPCNCDRDHDGCPITGGAARSRTPHRRDLRSASNYLLRISFVGRSLWSRIRFHFRILILVFHFLMLSLYKVSFYAVRPVIKIVLTKLQENLNVPHTGFGMHNISDGRDFGTILGLARSSF